MPPRRKRPLGSTSTSSSEHADSDYRPSTRPRSQTQSRASDNSDVVEDPDSDDYRTEKNARNNRSEDAQPAVSSVATDIAATQRAILRELEEEEQIETVVENEDKDEKTQDLYTLITESSGGNKEDQRLYKAIDSLFDACKLALVNYRSAKEDIGQEPRDGVVQSPDDDMSLLDEMEVRWLDDTRSLDRTIGFAHIWARHIAVYMLRGERPRDPGPDVDLDEQGEMAIDQFQKSGDMACGSGSWGRTCKLHGKALRMLATGYETQSERHVDDPA